ncbi:MAG: Hsp70 family protein, partial [Stellaceae bacterium]
MAADNKLLGQFDLVGIPSAPRGMPQVEVTFDIDANGIVQVSAKDKATGKEQQIRIQASGGLSETDIEKMVKDAEAHAEEDKRKRELVEAKNNADALIHTTERTISENGDKIPQADRDAAQQAVQALKDTLGSEDAGQIKAKTEVLGQLSMKLGEALYKAQQAGSGEGGPGSGGAGGPGQGGSGDAGGGDKVVDADFEEVDDQKKRGSA